MVGAWLAGMVSGGDVPNKSAAEAGAATARPAQARDNRTFIGHPRIAASTRDGRRFKGHFGGEYLNIV
jgi:hypothetical protein